MATRRERATDRRAWYAWKLARWLTAASIRASAWPSPDVEGCRWVYVGHSGKPRHGHAVVVEFEPDLSLDVDATWSARILLPECCRVSGHSRSIDVQLDEPDRDGIVPWAGRGARLGEVAARAGRAWRDHAAHAVVPRARAASEPADPTGVAIGSDGMAGDRSRSALDSAGGRPGRFMAAAGA